MSTAVRKKMHQDLQLAGMSEGTQDVYLLRRNEIRCQFIILARKDEPTRDYSKR